MADRPILFSAPMVRALLEGRKTQTRRIMKPQPELSADGTWHVFNAHGGVIGIPTEMVPDCAAEYCPYYRGDRLWVRETWQSLSFGDYQPTKSRQCEVRFAATDPCADLDTDARGYPWRPSIFMPRWASRLTLIVAGVRVERLQDCSVEDACAEGALVPPFTEQFAKVHALSMYRAIWTDINGEGSWEANPWVVAVTFEVLKQNIDEVA